MTSSPYGDVIGNVGVRPNRLQNTKITVLLDSSWQLGGTNLLYPSFDESYCTNIQRDIVINNLQHVGTGGLCENSLMFLSAHSEVL